MRISLNHRFHGLNGFLTCYVELIGKSGVSAPRNPRLFSYAIKDGIPYRGIGSGVRRALQLYADVSFENDDGGLFFKTIISSHADYEGDKMENNRGDNRGGNRGDNRLEELPEEQRKIVEIIKGNPAISVRSLAECLKIRKNTVFKQIEALKSKGALVREGGTRGRWRVIIE